MWQNDDIPITDLAQKTALEKSTLTRMLDNLEQAGLIQRVAPEDDRRKILIRLTAKNQQMKKVYDQVSREMSEIFYRGFKDAEIDIFEAELQKILTNLTEYEKK